MYIPRLFSRAELNQRRVSDRIHRPFIAPGTALGLLLSMVLLVGASTHARAQAGNTVTYAAGWNLVSGPLGTDFSSVDGSLSTLQPADSDYETIPPTQGTLPGYGYWAYFDNDTTVTLGSGTVDEYDVTLSAGQWVMVGDPSGTQAATISGADQVYTYDPVNGFASNSTLQPGQGAWVFSANGGTVAVTPNSGGVAPASGAVPPGARFYGAVTLSGQPAPDGTAVSAIASDGADCGDATTGTAPASTGNYALDLTGSDSGCATAGSTISFTVNGSPASGTGTVPDVSGAVHVDLSLP